MNSLNSEEDRHKTRQQLLEELRELRERAAAAGDNGKEEASQKMDLQWFRAIFENTPHVAIQGFDARGTVTHWNRASQEFYGYSAKDAVGRRIQDLIFSGETVREFEESLRTICKTGRPAAARQWETYDTKGERKWVYSTMFPIFDDGQVADIFCMDVDITERMAHEEELRKARDELEARVRERTEALELINVSLMKEIAVRKEYEAALSRSENFLNNIFDCIEDEITIMDRDLNVIAVNDAMERRFASKSPLIGKKCFAVYHGRNGPCEDCSGLRAMETGRLQTNIITKDGHSPQWREVFSFPFRDASDDIVGVISLVRDISERRRMEEALSFERSQLLSIFDSIDEIIYVSDPSTYKILYANRAMKERFGRGLVGEVCYEAIQGLSSPCEFCTNETILRNRGKSHVWEFYNKNVGRHLAITDRIIKWPDGRDVRFELAIDITDRKKIEEDLLQAKSEAELYVDLMGHDINNMNQVGIGYLELASDLLKQQSRLDKEHGMLLQKPLESLQNSSKLIDNVRKIQRERHGGYEAKVMDVHAMLQDLIPQFSSIAGRDIAINYDPVDRCRVKANELLKDVFFNLIVNAVKHSAGPLTIDIRQELVEENRNKYCKVAVEDNGPGIPDTLKRTLFDRLNLVNTRARGKGFGLCLIKMLVDDYGGRFWVEDRVAGDHTQGARFIVLLPAA